MAEKRMRWISSTVKGVRYREHPERMHRGVPDRYFSIRFSRQGRDIEEGLGWASEGWNLSKAQRIREKLRTAYTTGEGPATLAETRARLESEKEACDSSRDDAATYKVLAETYYLPWARREKKSAGTDEERLKNYLYIEYGDLPLSAITTADITAFRDRLLKKLSRATVKQILALLRKTFNHFSSLGLYTLRNPVSGVKMPRLDNACERFLTRAEYDRLVEAACETEHPELRDAIILSVHTGLRLGEICRLEAQDVDLAHGYVTVREDGGKPGGVVPLNTVVLTMLRRRMKGKVNGRVFSIHRQGKELSRQFCRLALTLGLNRGDEDRQHRLTFHSLRHTFASWLALADVELYRIQKLMRHKTPAMTQRYAHLRPSGLRNDVAYLCASPDPPGQDGA